MWAPMGYLLIGQLSLLAVLATIAAWPAVLQQGYLAPTVVGLAHLMTLGLVTATILGSLYLLSPFALRARMREGTGDLLALALFALGVVGMVVAFASGDVRAAALRWPPVVLALAWVAVHSLWALAQSGVTASFKVPFLLAWGGLAGTVLIGVLHGLDRSGSVLGGALADRVAAHAHLGLVGWALVLVVGAANRLLPMVLPAAMPGGIRVWGPPALLLAGAAAYASGRITALPSLALGGVAAIAGGIAAFLGNVAWMLRHRRAPARAVWSPDLPRAGALSALLSLAAATALGVALAGGWSGPRLVVAYGVLALLGFFAQLIVAMEQRLVPWLLWMRAYGARQPRPAPPSPYRLPLRPLQLLVTWSWAVGPWVLAVGAVAASTLAVRWAAVGLGLAVLAHAVVLAAYGSMAFRIRATREP